MLVTVRAYRHSDLDLMLLGDALGKNYSGFIRECLKSYLRGTPLHAGIPAIPFVPSDFLASESKSTGVMLKESDDADVIALLKNIRYGYRNNFIKNIIRMFTLRQSIASYADNARCFSVLMGVPSAEPAVTQTVAPVISPAPVILPIPEQPERKERKAKSVVATKTELPASVELPVPETSPDEPLSSPVAMPEHEDVMTNTEIPLNKESDDRSDEEDALLDMFAGLIG